MRTVLLAILLTTACDNGGGSAPADAAPDAEVMPVLALDDCPDTTAASITDSATAFIPKESTISVGDVVKFVITAEHFVIPNTLTTTDPALMVSRGETKCFQFNKPGTYGFLCGVHSFTGTITVQ
jgi:plastocyanin